MEHSSNKQIKAFCITLSSNKLDKEWIGLKELVLDCWKIYSRKKIPNHFSIMSPNTILTTTTCSLQTKYATISKVFDGLIFFSTNKSPHSYMKCSQRHSMVWGPLKNEYWIGNVSYLNILHFPGDTLIYVRIEAS